MGLQCIFLDDTVQPTTNTRRDLLGAEDPPGGCQGCAAGAGGIPAVAEKLPGWEPEDLPLVKLKDVV